MNALLTAPLTEACQNLGRKFARHEFDAFMDQGLNRCPWVRGEYCGAMPAGAEACDELYARCEENFESAAADEWERLWNNLKCV